MEFLFIGCYFFLGWVGAVIHRMYNPNGDAEITIIWVVGWPIALISMAVTAFDNRSGGSQGPTDVTAEGITKWLKGRK